MGVINGSSYYQLVAGSSWTTAKNNALSIGGNLVTINSESEHNFLITNFQSSLSVSDKNWSNQPRAGAWIGLNQNISKENRSWSSGETSSYSNIHASQDIETLSYHGGYIFIMLEPGGAGDGYWWVEPISGPDYYGTDYWLYNYGIAEVPLSYFSISDLTITEGNSGNVTISRTGGTNSAQTLSLVSSNGTATAGSDYTAINTTISFAAGETSKTFSISTTEDSSNESNETFALTLTASNTDTVPAQITDGNATITIEGYSIEVTSGGQVVSSLDEGSGFTVTFGQPGSGDGVAPLYWSYSGTGIDSADFSSPFEGWDDDGEFSTFAGLVSDNKVEGPETLVIKCFTDSDRTTQVASVSVPINDTSAPAPSYSLSTSSGSINEGDTLTTSVNSTNVFTGTTLYYSLSGTGITSSDFSSGALLGSGTVDSNGDFSFSHTLASDVTTEGNETLNIKLFSDSNRTNQVGSTSTVTISDTSEEDGTEPNITGPSGSAGDSSSTKSINENTTTVHTFSANETVTWSLNGGADASKFAINSSTGALTFSSAPNYESPTDSDSGNNYVVVVRATDSASNTSDQTVTISVADVDELDPNITGPSGSAGDSSSTKSINENTTTVHTFSANETVTWSLNGGADASKFAINTSTGALSFSSAPNYESPTDSDSGNNYVVVVRATDSASNTSDQTVTISVADVDELDPNIDGPSGIAGDSSSTKSINENTTTVHTFSANETVTWSLNGGADASKFAINTSTGALSFSSAPNYESPTDSDSGNNYVVVVRATDSASNTSDQTVTISVADVDESILDVIDPNIDGPSGSAGDSSSTKSINENTTTVHTFSANETVTWSLNGGADASKFAINTSTGALSFSSAPNYESPTDGDSGNNYVVVVRATDSASNTSDQTVTISVVDVDELDPNITGPSGSAGDSSSTKSINENTTTVHTFSANETVTWSLNGGADASKFAINTSTGALSFSSAPNYESPTDSDSGNNYVVVVRATDSASNTSDQTVTISVADVEEIEGIISGTSGNDSLQSTTSDDSIDGGSGTDTAILSGSFSDYSFARSTDTLQIEDQRTTGITDGTDTLKNIEYIQFSDQTVEESKVDVVKTYSGNFSDYKFYNKGNGKYEIKTDSGYDDITGLPLLTFTGEASTSSFRENSAILDIKGTFDQVTGLNTDDAKMFRLYNAAFKRLPDADGLKYWIGKYTSGENDDRAVAQSFLVSDEFSERYGVNVSNAKYVETLYVNVLGRDYDQDGYNYWLGNLNAGIETRYELLLGFAESAENKTLFTEMTGLG
ncbi:DUF4214 domain-containing protein [Prochlorococcus marinus]|uniref:DUF4214 domain-containing protein n=1 Tax=Prochlorococcus marinus TaxID=1219 RepID=UPI0022B34A38|nr:DUF4214 domain-containing protein [Prochlorococcus marinus]